MYIFYRNLVIFLPSEIRICPEIVISISAESFFSGRSFFLYGAGNSENSFGIACVCPSNPYEIVISSRFEDGLKRGQWDGVDGGHPFRGGGVGVMVKAVPGVGRQIG